jgi:hypothetical protein
MVATRFRPLLEKTQVATQVKRQQVQRSMNVVCSRFLLREKTIKRCGDRVLSEEFLEKLKAQKLEAVVSSKKRRSLIFDVRYALACRDCVAERPGRVATS